MGGGGGRIDIDGVVEVVARWIIFGLSDLEPRSIPFSKKRVAKNDPPLRL